MELEKHARPAPYSRSAAQAGPILPSPVGICRERPGPTTAPKQRDLLRTPSPREDEEEDLMPQLGTALATPRLMVGNN